MGHPELVQRSRQGDIRSGDRRGARAAIGLDDVAVEGDRPLSQPRQIHHGAERATDQPLDLVRPAADPALAGLALAALGPGTGKHAVLRGHPSGALAAQEGRDAILDGRGAHHPRVADADQHRSLRELEVVGHDLDGAKLVGGAPIRAAGDGGGRHAGGL